MKYLIIALALILAPGGVAIAGNNAQLLTKGLFKTLYPL